MAQMGTLAHSEWSEDTLAYDVGANGYVEGLETASDVEEERQTYRASLAALEAEVRRLNLELRAALEAKVDQEASQLAIEHGFLSPFVSKSTSLFASTTPQSSHHHRFSASQPSPLGLNASTILDDDGGFSFDGLQSPAMASSVSKSYPHTTRERESPTSRLLKTPSRPRPHFTISAPRNALATPQTPHFLHADLVPVPETEEGHGSTPNRGISDQLDQVDEVNQENEEMTNSVTLLPDSPQHRLATSAPPPSSSKKPLPSPSKRAASANNSPAGKSTPSGHLVLPPIQLTPESETEKDFSSARVTRSGMSPSQPRETPRTPVRNFPVTPADSAPYSQFVTPSIIRQGHALSHNFAYGAEPETRVLTKLVYVPATTHWCEHICLILFILLVITLSFSFGVILSQTGPPEWMQTNTVMYS